MGNVTTYAYDADGNVTATIDPLGRVTASTYDQLGNDTDDYQGQIVSSVTGAPGYNSSGEGSWTFGNLSPSSVSTSSALSYDVYVNSAAATSGYTLTGGTADSTPDSTAPSLGDGWQLLETVTLDSASTSALTVTYTGMGDGAHRGRPAPTDDAYGI